MQEFDILFSKSSVETVYTFAKDNSPDVTVYKCWKWYGGTLRVPDGANFDIDVVRENQGSEWTNYEFEEGPDLSDFEFQVDSSNPMHTEIIETDCLESGFEELKQLLQTEGYQLKSQQLVAENEPLAEITTI